MHRIAPFRRPSSTLPAASEAPEPGQANLAVSWCLIALSLIAGGVLGLWSFGGPVAAPPGFQQYDDVPRRLARLAHIAAVMLPVLNLLYVPQLGATGLSRRVRAWGCRLLLFGTVLLPLVLAAAAFWQPLKYLLPLPVTALIVAFLVPAVGYSKQFLGGRGDEPCTSD